MRRLRTRIQQQARQYVREHYSQEKFEQLFLEQLHEVLSMSRRAGQPVAGRRPCHLPASGHAIGRARLLRPPERSGAAVAGHVAATGAAAGLDRHSAGSSTTAASPPGCAGSFGGAGTCAKTPVNCPWLIPRSKLFFPRPSRPCGRNSCRLPEKTRQRNKFRSTKMCLAS